MAETFQDAIGDPLLSDIDVRSLRGESRKLGQRVSNDDPAHVIQQEHAGIISRVAGDNDLIERNTQSLTEPAQRRALVDS